MMNNTYQDKERKCEVKVSTTLKLETVVQRYYKGISLIIKQLYNKQCTINNKSNMFF